MPAVARISKRDRPGQSGFLKISEILRSQLTWRDLAIGLIAALLISLLLVVFRYHAIPDWKAGEIANEEIRVLQDTAYEDTAATEAERASARDRSPAVYDFNGALVARIERDVAQAFALARNVMAEKKAPSKGAIPPAEEADILAELKSSLGRAISPNVLPVFIRERFSASLEGRILRILDAILRDYIIDDQVWMQFLRDQRNSITVRDNTMSAEHTIAEAYTVRNRTAAREYLRQFQLQFADLAPDNRGHLLNYMDSLLAPNLLYNQAETDRRKEIAAARVPPVQVMLKQGKTIVQKGETVTPGIAAQLAALRRLQHPGQFLAQFGGYFVFVAAFLYGLWRYLVMFSNHYRKFRNQIALILLVAFVLFALMRLLTALADLVAERVPVNVFPAPVQLHYVVPFAFGAILITLLGEVNLGLISSMMMATLAGLFYRDSYVVGYAFLGSLAGVYSVRHYKDRAAILKAGLTIAIINMVAILGIYCLRQVPIQATSMALELGCGFIGGLFASALASTLLPTLESMFEITTDIRLLELSNLNAPILRRLSVEAPGTYHHSLMLATLAETAAEAVGANSLLVRVGAYYHDLGKMMKPEYYAENQSFGINKHESLSPNMSCLIIASHVKDGLELARSTGLPPDICDLIPQHHGTRVMTYFYRKALDAGGKNQEIDEVDFRYSGPKPQTKEAAILMMADSIEAASRTLSEPSPAQVQGMIDRLTDAVVADNQLDECDITLREIGLVKESFFKILTGLYHRRLDYPGYDFKTVEDKSALPGANPKHAKAV
jgi:putative nucleotidyltransferase with HDIG domain